MTTINKSDSVDPPGRNLDRDFLRQFIVLDRVGAGLGAFFVVLVNGAFVRNAIVWWIVPVLLLLMLALTAALRLCDRQETLRPLALIAAGNWLVAIIIPLFLPVLWPVMVVTVLAPVILAAPYLERNRIGLVLGMTGTVAALVAALGLLNDDGGALPDLADELELFVVIGSLVAQIIPVGFIAWHNNLRQQRQMERLLDLNSSLVGSRLDLLSSRRRVVEAADAERRKIERDLHDGAQQRLAALGMQLRLLEHELAEGKVSSTVARLNSELDEAVAEIRELAHGIYPTLLQDQGLAAALRPVVRRSGSRFELETKEIGSLDPISSAALYFTALEALANAAKHAPDSRVVVGLAMDGEHIELSIVDDGPGFDLGMAWASHGIQNMHDRLAAAGGTLVITASDGSGCRVEARVPSSQSLALS